MQIYIVSLVNEDGWVSIVGAYKTFEKARVAMRKDWKEQVDGLDEEGYVPVMKLDEAAASITYGDNHYYRYQIKASTVK